MISNVQGVTCARLPQEQRHSAGDVAANARAALSGPELVGDAQYPLLSAEYDAAQMNEPARQLCPRFMKIHCRQFTAVHSH